MKYLLILLACSATWLARAQGTVMFYNHVAQPRIDAPVFAVDGVTRLAGATFFAQLLAGPDAARLAPVGTPMPFQTGAGAGYWQPDVVALTGIAPGGSATVRVRVWETATAAGNPPSVRSEGFSDILTIRTGGGTGEGTTPPDFPTYLTGLKSFQLVPVPEPSVVALGILGGMLILARSSSRKRRASRV